MKTLGTTDLKYIPCVYLSNKYHDHLYYPVKITNVQPCPSIAYLSLKLTDLKIIIIIKEYKI